MPGHDVPALHGAIAVLPVATRITSALCKQKSCNPWNQLQIQ